MYQVNYNGMRKRDTYDEIVYSLENDKLKIKYPDRRASMMLNSPQVSNIRYGTSLDVDELHDKINKDKMIEHFINQMSSSTNTHSALNSYTYRRPSGVEPGVDWSMDENLDRQREHASQQVGQNEEQRRLRQERIRELLRSHLRSSVPRSEASSSATAHMNDNFYDPEDENEDEITRLHERASSRIRSTIPRSETSSNDDFYDADGYPDDENNYKAKSSIANKKRGNPKRTDYDNSFKLKNGHVKIKNKHETISNVIDKIINKSKKRS